MYKLICILILQVLVNQSCFSQKDQTKNFHIENGQVQLDIKIKDGELLSENISFIGEGISKGVIFDSNFSFDIVWTDWIAPGKFNNGENPIKLSKKDFEFDSFIEENLLDGAKKIEVLYKGKGHHLQVLITYQIEADKYYVKRKVAISDPVFSKHFLQKINALEANLINLQNIKIIKKGGFGQPIAFQINDKGFFSGLEYPASTNTIKESNGTFQLNCNQHKGKTISNKWIESDWVVFGLVPDTHVKKAFWDYVNDIKISPVKPYTLYNSWYDLRGDEYPVGSYVKELRDEDYMNDKNVFRLYNLIKENFTDKYNVTLDAFVLDDGWDIYESPWQLNPKAFPNGFSPTSRTFNENNTKLGVWFGPSGGYSARMKRINWYRENGYEVVGEEKRWGGAQLCLGGNRYSKVFKDRTLEFVKQGVSYFKWDGFQFSCSEVSHGHPIGVYSRGAILDTLLSSIESIHKVNPKVYHSVSSGTWLSPWWLKHANQIWMQGEDYGYSDVPSYNLKDAAITYRDVVLYDNLQRNNYWFPISNMMTHGIIKGRLEEVHLDVPLDKFTDNAILYFARGVSMYELYTSPDVMNEQEWEVVAQSLKWAKANFDVLMNTEMIGGNPGKKQAYGYLHLKNSNGILAARNPYIEDKQLEVHLSPEFGIAPNAKNLVLAQIYPKRWISPTLYKSGDKLSIPLQGYETAIYEIFPLEDSIEPLLAGVSFDSQIDDEGNWVISYSPSNNSLRILNAELVESIEYKNQIIEIDDLLINAQFLNKNSIDFKSTKRGSFVEMDIGLSKMVGQVTLGFLLKSNESSINRLPEISFKMNDEQIQPKINGNTITKGFKMPNDKSGWYSFEGKTGNHHITLEIKNKWAGTIEVWVSGYESQTYQTIKVKTKDTANQKALPPQINTARSLKKVEKVGSIKIK